VALAGSLLVAGAAAAQFVTLEQAGWRALSDGRYAEAADVFRRAVAAEPRRATLRLGAGAAAFFERRDDEALVELNRSLELDPDLTAARELLGLVLYRRGDVRAAIREYERLTAGGPVVPRAVDYLERWRRESDLRDQMTLTAGDGYTVSFDGPPDAEIATRTKAALDKATQRIGQALLALPLAPVSVVLYTSEQFRDITRAPDWAAGAYDGIVRIPVRDALGDQRELDRVVAHEFTHAVVHALAARGVPTWLNEGLATVLESDVPGPVERAAAADPNVQLVPLGLLGTSFGRLAGEQAAVAYGRSAMAVRRMIEEAGGFAIANLLRDLGSGTPFDEAFARRMSISLENFEAATAQRQ
jgi:hypothetical protein